ILHPWLVDESLLYTAHLFRDIRIGTQAFDVVGDPTLVVQTDGMIRCSKDFLQFLDEDMSQTLCQPIGHASDRRNAVDCSDDARPLPSRILDQQPGGTIPDLGLPEICAHALERCVQKLPVPPVASQQSTR